MSLEDDCALACACVDGDREALARLENEVMKPVEQVLTRRFGKERAQEAVQRTRARLLVAAPGSLPKLSEYQGRGPLLAWVRTVATRVAIDGIESLDSAWVSSDIEDLDIAYDPDLAAQAVRYKAHFEAAFRAALQSLARRDRVALRMSVVDGLTNEKIAAVFHVHPSSVGRWLAQAQATLREVTFLSLQGQLGLGRQSALSVVGMLAGDWQVSIASGLKGGVDHERAESSDETSGSPVH